MRLQRNSLPEHPQRYSPCALRSMLSRAMPVSFESGSSQDPALAGAGFARVRSRSGFPRKATQGALTSEQLFLPPLARAARTGVELSLRSLVVTPNREMLIGSYRNACFRKSLSRDI